VNSLTSSKLGRAAREIAKRNKESKNMNSPAGTIDSPRRGGRERKKSVVQFETPSPTSTKKNIGRSSVTFDSSTLETLRLKMGFSQKKEEFGVVGIEYKKEKEKKPIALMNLFNEPPKVKKTVHIKAKNGTSAKKETITLKVKKIGGRQKTKTEAVTNAFEPRTPIVKTPGTWNS